MADETLLKSGDVEITTKVARFGQVTYQIANVGSVAVHVARKLNPIAVGLFLLAVIAGFVTNNAKNSYSDNTEILFAIALALLVAAIAVQLIWPKHVSTFVLKTSSNDVHKMESPDVASMYAIQHALEEAFIRRGWS